MFVYKECEYDNMEKRYLPSVVFKMEFGDSECTLEDMFFAFANSIDFDVDYDYECFAEPVAFGNYCAGYDLPAYHEGDLFVGSIIQGDCDVLNKTGELVVYMDCESDFRI